MKKLIIASATTVLALALPALAYAETVGVFFDPAVAQINFAAGDVKAALEKSKFTVEMLPVASLNSDLGVTINNIQAMACLTLYYAHKIRGATHLKAKEIEKAKNAVGSAYCWWMKYSNLMDSMYHGMAMARTVDLSHWHAHDQSVLKEYTDLGGVGTPGCENWSRSLKPNVGT